MDDIPEAVVAVPEPPPLEAPVAAAEAAVPEAPVAVAEAPVPEAPVAVAEAITAGAAVTKKIAEAPMRLDKKAHIAHEDNFIAVATIEDLRKVDKEQCLRVKEDGLGTCGRCKYFEGCDRCHEGKAWSYACRATLWHTAAEAKRPAAKPRGRPKKAAA